MIIDAHCHVWRRWPYDPPVPDPESRAEAGQLLYEMDAAGVDRAVIICARIGDNADNVEHAFAAAGQHPDRFIVFPDIDCRWSPDHRTPGAAARLQAALAHWSFIGFTHYLDEAEDGSWLAGDEGLAFFRLAESRRLIASLSVLPHQMPHVIALASACPDLPILLHHHAFLGPRTAATHNALDLVIAAATEPNVFIKLSGMGNVAASTDEYPYANLQATPRALASAFGPDRLVWGSDYPVSRRHMTYAQARNVVARHGPFAGPDLDAVMGGTMARLIAWASMPE